MASWDGPRLPASALLLTTLGAEHGLPPEICLARTGLTELQLADPRTSVSGDQELRIIRNLIAVVDDPAPFAVIAGSRYHLTTHGSWGTAIASSATFADAIEVGARYVDLTWAFSKVTTVRAGTSVQFVFGTDRLPADVADFLALREIASLVTLGMEVGLPPTALRRVGFRIAKPPDLGSFREVFGIEPEFGLAMNVVELDAGALNSPLPQADLHARMLAEEQCRELIQRLRKGGGLAGQVRGVLAANPQHMPDIETVAAAMHLSSRTLRRRLDAEHTSFRALVDEVRERVAEDLLRTTELSVEMIAQRLGYGTTPAFTLAFKRWKGLSPRAFRALAG